MAKAANSQPKPALLVLIAIVGLTTEPATPWIFRWAFLLMFGLVKAPQDIRDGWRRRRLPHWEAKEQCDQ